MAHVVSRVNGLKIAIPTDARGVIHRFAISGGGNELVFDPITKSMFNKSKATESAPVQLGGDTPAGGEAEVETEAVELGTNLVDDEPKPKTRRKRKPAAEEAII